MRRSSSRARERRTREREREVSARSARVDRGLIAAAATLALAGLAYVNFAVEPASPFGSSYQLLILWLVLAAVAARGLVGRRSGAGDVAAAGPWVGMLGWWPLVGLAAVLPYLHSLNIGFLSDDFGLAAAARAAQGPLDVVRLRPYCLFYRPLSEVAWWAGVQVWGGAPLGYHLLSLALHAGNSLLVYLVGLRLTGSRLAAGLAGLLFAVHPIHVEPVVWASCQPDLLATGLCLLSLASLEACLAAGGLLGRAAALMAALAGFLLALVSKESAAALPGVVVLRLAVLPERVSWRRLVGLGGTYAVVLGAFAGWRFSVLGAIGGYEVAPGFWDRFFPSAPLRQIEFFLFPLNRHLLGESVGPAVMGAMVLLMAGGAAYVLGNLSRVPARRLWFYLGFVVLMSVPVWTLCMAITGGFESTRFAYLPTVGLMWLIGEVLAGCVAAGRRGGAAAATVIVLVGALTVWYVMPWRGADRVAKDVVAAARGMVRELPASEEPAVLFVRELPDTYRGAQVFRNCFHLALSAGSERPVIAHVVASGARSAGLPAQVVEVSNLLPGEYEVSWREETRTMEITRAGPPAAGDAARGAGP